MPEFVPPNLLDLRTRLQAFFANELAGLATGDEAEVPAEVAQTVRRLSRERGFFGLMQPAEYGGQNIGTLGRVVAYEAVAAANSPLGRYVFGAPPGLIARATGALRDAYLEPVLLGDKRGSFAFTEPSGPDAPARQTWATRDGDDLLITGQKSYVSGGATADFYTAMVNVEASGDIPGGPAMVVIERGTAGVELDRRFNSMDGGHHVSLKFDRARVPVANIIGKVGEGMQRAMGNITEERIELSAAACGMAQWAVHHVAEHITAPHPSGQRLGDREGVRLRYSDLQIETYVARSVLYRTGRLAESGAEIINEAMATKVFCTESAGRVIDGAVQLVGGQALIAGHPLEALYRRVRSLRLAGGASDIMRLQVARGRIEFGAGRI